MSNGLSYLNGFNHHFESEAIKDTLPKSRNSPQRVNHGLYAEQISGNAFTVSRHHNKSSWLYRIRPSVIHEEFKPYDDTDWATPPMDSKLLPPTQMRWNPQPYPDTPTDFVQGIMNFAGNGSASEQNGAAILLYACNQSMVDKYFYDADGELLIIPQEGRLRLHTEFGQLEIEPCEIALIPRGVKFQVSLLDDQARGYICENFGAHFRLPELGIIGANGLANPRDFLSPIAHYENKTGLFDLICKSQGHLWKAKMQHSPLDVVAWHGNHLPYKYDLRLFNTIGSISFDHPDPSIFTVLTSPSLAAEIGNVDFAIFPPRWMVANDTFRPPYYHRNVMSEFMGLIHGSYDAKETGFVPGGSSLHNCMSAHGPDAQAFEQASSAQLTPEYYDNTLAFMLESRQTWNLTATSLYAKFKQKDYLSCWQGLPVHFKEPTPA